MSRVLIQCKRYAGAYQQLNRWHEMDVTPWRFIAASLTLGFQRFPEVLQAGPRLWLHRLGLGFSGAAYLADVYGQLCLTGDHANLDASEKGAMSYWQGMVLAKLAAAEILGIRWLQHADAMEKRGVLIRTQRPLPRGRRNPRADKRADMAGQDDTGGWHIIEAKGFSSHPGLPAFEKAKTQAGMVASINQTVPLTTTGCVASLWKTPIEIVMDDPPPVGNEFWSIPHLAFWQDYYGGLADYIRGSKRLKTSTDQPGFTFASLSPLLGLLPLKDRQKDWQAPMIGLPDDILADPTKAPKLLPRLFAQGPLDRVAEDGVALVGTIGGWTAMT